MLLLPRLNARLDHEPGRAPGPRRPTDRPVAFKNRSGFLQACLLGLLLIGAAAPSSLAQFTPEPVWSDEFSDTGSPDAAKWGFETGGGGWGNGELQHYTARTNNARVENGMLVINALHENYGGSEYTSARLHSVGGGNWTYGRVVVRARFTGAQGTWPAIWMLPTDWVYGGWPDSGEVDLMEHVSTHGMSVQASIHTRDYNFKIGTAKSGFQYNVDYWNWHDYIIEWYPGRLDVSLDGSRFFTFRNEYQGYGKWPFDQRFHLMLNVAVGGWGGWPTFTSETMEIDQVRAYAYTAQPQVLVHPQAWYRLVNRRSGKVLDIDGPSTADGANLHQWEWYSLTNQQWRFEPAGDGSFRVISRYSGKACDVADASWANGANVQQWPTNGTPAQEWWLQPAGDGYCKVVNRETGRVLDVADLATTNGANVQQWDYVGGANQQWLIDEVVPPPAPPIPTGLRAEAGGERVTLFWNADTNTASYRLKRAGLSGGPYVSIASNLTQATAIDSGLVAGQPCYYVVCGQNGSVESPSSLEATAIPWDLIHAVNAGGAAVPPFSADAFFSGGTPSSNSAAIDLSSLTNPAPQTVYQSERYGSMTYTLSGLATGVTYRVRLHFAETYFSQAGQREFNVSINGSSGLRNFDIVAAAGTKNKAIIRQFDRAANASGQMVIQFTPLVDNPTFSGLEIWRAPDLTPPTLSLARSEAGIELSWPSSATAFNLYSAATLEPPLSWLPVTNPAVSQSNQMNVTLPRLDGPRFFRLSAP